MGKNKIDKSISRKISKYVISHEYNGGLSMKSAFREVIEKQVMDKFDKWKYENLK